MLLVLYFIKIVRIIKMTGALTPVRVHAQRAISSYVILVSRLGCVGIGRLTFVYERTAKLL